MNKLVLFALSIAPLFAQAENYARPEGYDAAIPNAQARKQDSAWKAFPGFDTIHIVEENTGKAIPDAAKNIKDQSIKSDVASGYYKSLQVRDLYIKPASVTGPSTTIPFSVSVKHSFSNWSSTYGLDKLGSTVNQGTVEVLGTLKVEVSDKVVKVTVTAFNDSQALESYGRFVGANHGIDLEWAKRIVEPTLEAYFQDPAHVGQLLGQEIPTKL